MGIGKFCHQHVLLELYVLLRKRFQ